jgi:uncharacterized protein YecT (DUF1311 family)
MTHPLHWSIVVVILFGSLLGCGVAQADWSIDGAQYSCRPDSRQFEMVPYTTFSSTANQLEHTPLKTGFRKVLSGSPIACVIAGHTLRTTVKIIGPYDGNGMGGGRVDITSMTTGALKLSSTTEYLGWSAEQAEDRLIHIRVTGEEGFVSIERCYGWISLARDEIGKENIDHCETKKIAIPPMGVPIDEDVDNIVDPCIKEGGGILYCQGASIVEDNRAIDTDLNATYKTLRNRLHGTPLERNLVLAERKWIHDRDKRCRNLSEDGFDNDNDRNAAHQAIAVAFQSCIQNELRIRLEFLQAALLRLNKEGIDNFRL